MQMQKIIQNSEKLEKQITREQLWMGLNIHTTDDTAGRKNKAKRRKMTRAFNLIAKGLHQ